ncbi:MAG: HD domain-containing protein [Candidatus Thorarchaeota archaeon]
MNYKEKVIELLSENMTEKGFKLWEGINRILPDIWNKPTSSTGKFHRKMNGEVPDVAEHVYEMLYSAVKLFKMLNIEKKTSESDKLLFAVVLHDSLKYGKLGTRKHTDTTHDREAADMIASNKDIFLKLLTEEQFNTLEEAVRFHSGQWSTDAPKDKKFDFKDYNPESLVVHMLDMMSTADLIQTDVRK